MLCISLASRWEIKCCYCCLLVWMKVQCRLAGSRPTLRRSRRQVRGRRRSLGARARRVSISHLIFLSSRNWNVIEIFGSISIATSILGSEETMLYSTRRKIMYYIEMPTVIFYLLFGHVSSKTVKPKKRNKHEILCEVNTIMSMSWFRNSMIVLFWINVCWIPEMVFHENDHFRSTFALCKDDAGVSRRQSIMKVEDRHDHLIRKYFFILCCNITY